MDISVNNTTPAAYTATPPATRQTVSQPAQQTNTTRADRLELSGKAPQEDAFTAMKERLKQMRTDATAQADQAKQKAEAEAEALKVKLLCFQIAMRILAGDKVPPEDEKYLLDNDPDLYNVAVSARIQKEDPEEYDSLLEDDEDEDEASGSVDGVSPPASIGEAVSGGEAASEAAPAELVE